MFRKCIFSPPAPPKLSLRKTQKWQGQVPSGAILISSFPLMPVTVETSCRQAIISSTLHSSIQWQRDYLGQLVILWDLREDNAVPPDSLMHDQQGSCTSTKKDSASSFHPLLFGQEEAQSPSDAVRQDMHLVCGASKEPLCTTGWKETQKELLELPSKPCS